MIVFTKGTASENFIVTLNEKMTLTAPYFLFVFTHVETKAEVTKIYNSTADISGYPSRYNKFSLATVTVFANSPMGMWNYRVYEQPGGVNTDPDNATTLVESGIMRLKPATEFSMTEYNESQTYRSYNG